MTAAVTILLAPRASTEETEAYLQGPEGPYRGRVVEVLTDTPLEGALVVTVWEQDRDGERVVVGAREVLTDATGAFQVETGEIERTLPPRTFPPRALIYKQGYGTIPREAAPRFGVPAQRFARDGVTVTLKRARDGEEWTEAFHTFYESLQQLRGDGLRERLPQSLRAFQEGVQFVITELKRNPGYWGLEKSE